VKGIQSRNIGVSVKHFAANSQENRRMSSDSIVDERTLREIYLAAFERVVKQAKPWTLMCAYNRLNGEFCSENRYLLTDILRDEWGFDGIVMSDWGAVSDRVKGVESGLDLEMPGGDLYNDAEIVKAVNEDRLFEHELDACAERIVELILRSLDRVQEEYDAEVHHALARRIAIASSVLVKNEGLLPASIFKSAAVIGTFADVPRYQGSGSSRITPTMLDTAKREFTKAGVKFTYAPGYNLDDSDPNEELIAEACEAAKGKDIVYIFAGLPDAFESEGFDRDNLKMPRAHTELIRRVSEVNENVAVILSCGSVVDMSWESYAKAILISYLGGQTGAGAAVDILLGRVNPCGKLAETWPYKLEDVPSSANFPGTNMNVEYREGLNVGYRYFDTAGVAPRYPFGYGLSYTKFEITDLLVSARCTADDGELTVSCMVTNMGSMPGAEIVQLYVAPAAGDKVYRPAKELKGFEKVRLNPGESKRVWFKLGGRDFAYYNVDAKAWTVDEGNYIIGIGNSSRNIRLQSAVFILNTDGIKAEDKRAKLGCYYDVKPGVFASDAEFEALLGHPIPDGSFGAGPFTINSCVNDLLTCEEGRKIMDKYMENGKMKALDDDDFTHMFEKSFLEMPIRSLGMMDPEVFSKSNLPKLVERLNKSIGL
ncbi:MAG: glycoside hydrolase family 3 C-terminal domain-containing protein, partial [Oscillospiraceae bacterium]|nr:glycoside hydrolase family 3 C-terminal domain-containing protein [Oscillospiraceae bacterium]